MKKNFTTVGMMALPLVAAWLILLLCFFHHKGAEECARLLCEQMAAPAVVLAGFSTAAFHLRFRLVDGIVKLEKKSQVEHMATVFSECRKSIDHCLVVFVITTVLLVVGKFHMCILPAALMWLAAVSGGAFVHCMLKFMQILKALRFLEDFLISRAKEAAKFN